MTAAVIFDLDGTLVDSAADIAAAVNRMLAGIGEPPMPVAEVQSYVGNGAPALLVARVLAARRIAPARHAALTAALLADYAANPGDAGSLYSGALAALDALAAQGLRLGLCTNKPIGPTRLLLGRAGLGGCFHAVIGGDSLPQRKPDPAPLLTVWRAPGTAAAIYVGDSGVDDATARAAGLPFVFHSGGYLNAPRESIDPIAEFADFGQLPAIVSRLLSFGRND